MIDLLNMRNLCQIIDKPTQRAGHTLDWVICEDTNFISNVNICDKAISDHSVITFNINIDSALPSKRNVSCRNIKLTNSDLFKSEVRECGSFINSQQNKSIITIKIYSISWTSTLHCAQGQSLIAYLRRSRG